MKKVLSGNTSGQPLAIVVRKAFKMALNMGDDHVENIISDMDVEDLRQKTGYDSLKQAGYIADKDEW